MSVTLRTLAGRLQRQPAGPRTEAEGAREGRVETAQAQRIARRDAHFRRLLAIADAVAISASLSLCAAILGDDRLAWAALAAPIALIIVAKAMGLYDRDEHLLHKTTFEELPSILALATVSVLLLYLGGDVLIDGNLGRRQILAMWIILIILMILLRSTARAIGLLVTPPERCLLVGNSEREESLRRTLELTTTAHAELIGVVPALRPPSDDPNETPLMSMALLEELDVDRVIVAPPPGRADELMFMIRELRDAGVKVSVLPNTSRLAASSFELDYVGGIGLLGMRRFAISRSSMLIKRAFDVSCSLVLLVLLGPLMAGVAFAIRLDTPGSVFFRQRRVGRKARGFSMLKFRSMVSGSETRRDELRHLDEGADGLFKIPDDPRTTRVGRWIRRASIDELPQLFNVLRGDMSLVGPRPLVAEEDEKIVGLYRRRLDVRPGMTGHWQVLGSARVPLDEMVRLDYLYASNWSLWGDLVLLARTMPVIARRRGL